jgi:hypothetical protein
MTGINDKPSTAIKRPGYHGDTTGKKNAPEPQGCRGEVREETSKEPQRDTARMPSGDPGRIAKSSAPDHAESTCADARASAPPPPRPSRQPVLSCIGCLLRREARAACAAVGLAVRPGDPERVAGRAIPAAIRHHVGRDSLRDTSRHQPPDDPLCRPILHRLPPFRRPGPPSMPRPQAGAPLPRVPPLPGTAARQPDRR